MRYLAAFLAYLIGEAAMVIHPLPSIKMGRGIARWNL